MEERLDRALASPGWVSKFPNCKVHHQPFILAYHSPLMINTNDDHCQQKRTRIYRFERCWTLFPESKTNVSKFWSSNSTPNQYKLDPNMLDILMKKLHACGRKKYNKFESKIR